MRARAVSNGGCGVVPDPDRSEAAEFLEDVFHRVDVSLMNDDLVMEMGPGAAAARADLTDHVAALDPLTDLDIGGLEVPVAGDDTVAMRDEDGGPESAHPPGPGDDTVRR